MLRPTASDQALVVCADGGRSNRAHIMGVKVSETTAEIKIDTAKVMANSWNKRPTTSAMNNSGINTAISEKVSEMMVKPIWREPLKAAAKAAARQSPSCASPSLARCSKWRAMFSIITMASSTTKPLEMVKAIKVRLLIEKPARYITPKVPTSDSGTATLGIKVAAALRKNKKITITTKATASINSNCTSRTDARMVTVRSLITCRSTESGSSARKRGNKAWIRSTVSITLAPGWRRTCNTTAGVWLAHAAKRLFSGASMMLATSRKRKGLPLR